MTLAISERQITKMEDQRRDQFFRNLKAEIIRFMAEADPLVSQETVVERVDAAFVSAAAAKIITEQQITRYSYILSAIPLDFRSKPEFDWFVAVLDCDDTANARLDRLSAVLSTDGTL